MIHTHPWRQQKSPARKNTCLMIFDAKKKDSKVMNESLKKMKTIRPIVVVVRHLSSVSSVVRRRRRPASVVVRRPSSSVVRRR